MRGLPFDYAVRNLGRSPLRLALAVGGSALVAILVMAGVGFARGMSEAADSSACDGNALLLGAGSEESVERSEISPQVATLVAAEVEGIRERLDVPFVSPEVHAALPLEAPDGARVALVFRGVTPAAFLVHPQVRIVEGRAPNPGADELLLGTQAAMTLERAGIGSGVGATIEFEGRPLTVVGRMQAPGAVMDGEIWMPIHPLRLATQRTSDSCVVVALGQDDAFGDLDAFAAMRVDLELVAIRERDYYAALDRFLAPVRWLVLATAGLLALGGVLGGISTMDAAFATRVREYGTLQAIGYSRRAILRSLVVESVLASMSGAVIAAVLALAFLDGLAVRSSMGSFALRVDAAAIGAGFVAGLALAIIGAAIPAIRCLVLPIPQALKASV